MLLNLHHDFADAQGDLVRKDGAIAMPKEQKPTIPDMTGAAREAAGRVADNPRLVNEGEFDVWASVYLEQARCDLVKSMGTMPSVALGIQ